MTNEILNALGVDDFDGLDAVKYAQACMDIYQESMVAMGLSFEEPSGRTVESCRVQYRKQDMELSNYGYV